MCCCCVCHCQDEEDRPYSCCGCFPIKCGLITIGILTLLVTVALFIEIFYCLLNEYIHWWYVPVALLMICPLIVGSIFVIRFFTKDQQGSRTRMWIAMLLAIISFTLLAIWNLIYFQWLYKYDIVFAGADVVGYTMQTKKAFMVWSLFIGIVLDFTWAYFLCVATTYATCKDGEQEPIDWTGGAGDMVPKMGGEEGEGEKKWASWSSSLFNPYTISSGINSSRKVVYRYISYIFQIPIVWTLTLLFKNIENNNIS